MVTNLRAPLLIGGALTGGTPNLRSPLVVTEALTGGNPKLRAPLIIVQALIPIPEPLPVATLVFPNLRGGMKWDRGKSPSYNNARREMTSGRRSVTPYMTYPRWNFELSYDVLPSESLASFNQSLDTMNSLVELYKQTQGGAQTFLYPDPDDFHIVAGTIATADGVTLQWPFYAPIMAVASLEPVGQLDLSTLATFASTAVNTGTSQINIPNHGLTTGQGPLFVANPGTLPTGIVALTPYWVIVIDASHIQLAATEPQALASDNITLSAAGAGTNTLSKGWAAYETTTETDSVPASPAYTITPTHAAHFVSDGGVTISGTPLTKVASAPAANQYAVNILTGVYTFNSAQASASAVITYTWLANPALCSLTLPNQLVFGSAPASGALITADFDYYFVCRFDDDKLALNEFVSKLWDLQKLNFSSEIQ